jgi:hypothetical protein
MKKYLAWDSVNGEHETFDTLNEAQYYLTECFLCDGEYHPDIENFCIYELHSRVSYDVVDSKDNYEYENEEDIPDNDKISEAWPYDNEYDEIWKHKFMVENGLGEEDMMNDITYPHEL